jgi:hypothetical protein
MGINYDATAQSLIEKGYALLKDDASLMPMVRKAFSEGQEFFRQCDEAKRAASSPSRLEGYRHLGAEFSQTPERPDLCESFSVWCWNATEPEIRGGELARSSNTAHPSKNCERIRRYCTPVRIGCW